MRVLLVTNFERFPETWTTSDGTKVHSVFAQRASEFLAHRDNPEAIFVVNCYPTLVLELAARQLHPLRARRPIVAVDMVLRETRNAKQRVIAFAKKLLFRNVDYFVHYFANTRAIDDLYGIGGDRARFVEFKANIWEYRSQAPQPDGEYVVCFGRSLRDYETFFDAMARLGYPAVIVDPRDSLAWEHGSRLTRPLEQIPVNVKMIRHDGSSESEAAILAGARVVVLPLIKGALVPPISTIMNAMAVGKCVIATDGPGVSEAFDGEILRIPAQDLTAMTTAIRTAWTDSALRTRLATAGWQHAQRCGGERELYERVINLLVREYRLPATKPVPALHAF